MLPSILIVTKYSKCSISSNGNFQLTGASDVPWVFIGGRFIGGAEETVAAHKFDLVNIITILVFEMSPYSEMQKVGDTGDISMLFF